MTRVLHVLDKLSIDSGVSVMVMNYYKHLDHNRLTFDFMLNEDVDQATRDFIEGLGSKIFIMPSLKTKNLFLYVNALVEFYKNNDYKIVHGHIANSAVFYLGLANQTHYKIIHSHSARLSDVPWKRVRNWILTRFVKLVANQYIACSDDAAKSLFSRNEQVTLLNNAIDVQRYFFNSGNRETIRKSLGLSNEFLIGHVGRFCAAKNHQFIISVFKEVYQHNRNVHLLLIGEGELKQEILQKVESLDLSDVVTILGATSEIENYLSAMDVLILPSQFEGLGLIGVEAQASGLKVIASDKVPAVMDATGNVEFLKLDRQLWVEQLLELKIEADRLERGKLLIGSVFDMDTQIQYLYNYYDRFL